MKNLILTLIITLPLTLLGQGWEQTFGGEDNDYGHSVQQTTDGGYVITGNTQSFGNGDSDIYLIKTDENGNELWSQTYGGEGDDIGWSVQQTTDGGYIIIGHSESYYGNIDVCLIKTDENGNEQWFQTFGDEDSYDEKGYSVQQTTDGGFIICGIDNMVNSPFNSSSDVLLIKTDENGNEQWSQTFGGDDFDIGYSVQQTTDGGYVITGNTQSFGNGDSDIYLIKTDENGNELWSQTYGGSQGLSVQQTTDGGYIICGRSSGDIYLIKTYENGNEQWSQVFEYDNSGYSYGCSVQQTTDGGYIISGFTSSFGNGNSGICLNKTDENGYEQWSQIYGGQLLGIGSRIQQTTDGGFIIGGSYTNSFGNGDRDVYLIKTDGYGNVLPYESTLWGCDSIESLTNETYIFESGTQIDTLTNMFGSDSVIVQNFNVFDSPDNIIIEGITDVLGSTLELYEVTINSNNSIEWDVYGGTISEENGNTIQVLWSNVGVGYVEVTEIDYDFVNCSTTSTLEVTISNDSPISYNYLSVCDSIQNLTNETYINESGTYTNTLTNIFGGDSVIVQEIEILNSPEFIQINGNENVIPTSLEFYQIINISNDIQWNIEGGSIYENQNNIIQVLWGNEGIGYVEVTETDTNGCSTTSTLEVTISNEPTNIYEYNKTRKLIKTINLLGQEIKPQKNQSYIEIFDDGTRKRKIIIE